MTGTSAPGGFDELMADLETLHKSMGDDDAAIQQAAAKGGEGEDPEEPDHEEPDEDNEGGPSDGDADNEPMGKSFTFTTDDGDEVQAFDATELLKSLTTRVDDNTVALRKALSLTVETLGKQDQQIKALRADVAALKASGRGRKAVVTVPTPMQKSEPAPATGQEFMAKCLAAQSQGRITGIDVARAEAALNRGIPVPQDIVARVTQ